MKYEIRRLNIDDYDSLMRLWSKCELPSRPKGRDSRTAIEKELKRDETAFIGMFDNGRLIGVVLGTSDGRKGWINRLAVAPEYRHRGLGLALIDECEKFLHGLGLKVLACLIEGDNQASFAAFKKAGYTYHDDIAYYSKRPSPED
jgi:ribosomal protein S18 acetylase RimI-like enzyme